MPVGKESKLGLYIDAVKEWLPSARLRLQEWGQACREEPTLIWQTPAVRYATYGLGAILAAWVVSAIFSAAGPAHVAEPARTADFHVVCSNPGCGHHFVINRKFRFDDFPVECPKCKQLTGRRGIRYMEGPCAGRWVVADVDDDGNLSAPPCVVSADAP